MKQMFRLVADAIARVLPLHQLRWIAFSHIEADECGPVKQFLAAAPKAQVAHGATGCMVSLDDMLSRPSVRLSDREVIPLGGAEVSLFGVQHVDTPHVPHNWESRVLFEETTGTLFCGDLFTQTGNPPAVTSDDLVDAALTAEGMFCGTSLAPAVPATLRKLADLEPTTLAIMHGAAALNSLADAYEATYRVTRLSHDDAASDLARVGL
jgi:flavorubredoxin